MESKKFDPVFKSLGLSYVQMKSDMPSKISYSVPFGTTKKTKLREKVFIKTMIKKGYV